MQAEKNAADIGWTVAILERLRSGRTNEAIQLLESQLNGALMGIGAAPPDARDPKFDTLLKRAQQYRSKYPH